MHWNGIGTSAHTQVCFFFFFLDCWFSWKCLIFAIAPYQLCRKNLHPHEKVGGLASVLDNSWSPWRATSPTSAALFLTSQAVWSDSSPKYNCQCAKHASYIWLQKQPVLFETDGGMWSRGPRTNGRNNTKDGNPVSQVHINSVFAEWCASHQITPLFFCCFTRPHFLSRFFKQNYEMDELTSKSIFLFLFRSSDLRLDTWPRRDKLSARLGEPHFHRRHVRFGEDKS